MTSKIVKMKAKKKLAQSCPSGAHVVPSSGRPKSRHFGIKSRILNLIGNYLVFYVARVSSYSTFTLARQMQKLSHFQI